MTTADASTSLDNEYAATISSNCGTSVAKILHAALRALEHERSEVVRQFVELAIHELERKG